MQSLFAWWYFFKIIQDVKAKIGQYSFAGPQNKALRCKAIKYLDIPLFIITEFTQTKKARQSNLLIVSLSPQGPKTCADGGIKQ